MDDKKTYLDSVYRQAVAKSLCSTKKEFAELLAVNYKGLSAAMNGDSRFLTDSLVRKVRAFALEYHLEEKAQPRQNDGVFIPRETLNLYENLSATCRTLSALLDRAGVITPFSGAEFKAPRTKDGE